MDVFSKVLRDHRSYLRAAAIEAAYALGLFSALGAPADAEQLAAHLGHDPRRLRRLLDVLVLEAVVLRSGPAGRPVFSKQRTPERPPAGVGEGWGRLAEVIAADSPISSQQQDSAGREAYHEHLEEAGSQGAAHFARSLLRDQELSLLDVGCGSGVYSRAFLSSNRNRRATLLDRAEVLDLARDSMAGFQERVVFQAGDALDFRTDQDCDLVLLCNLLHLYPPMGCKRILANSFRALRPGGRLLVKELKVDVDRSGPPLGVYFALNMALYTEGGDTYSASEISSWLGSAGLTNIQSQDIESSPDVVVVEGTKPLAAMDEL